MSNEDWIAILARGHLALTLPAMQLMEAGAPRFHGTGRIVWNRNSGVSIHAVTGGAEELRKSFGRAHTGVGKLIPLETYLSATGQTQDGWDVSTIAVPRQGYTVSSESPHVLWEIPSGGVTMTRSLPVVSRPHRRTIRALLEPPPTHWPRTTTTEIHNEFFGGTSLDVDWLQTTSSVGTLAGRRHSDRALEVLLVIESDSVSENPFEIVHAVAQAFSFVLGRRVWIDGLEDVTSDRRRRELYPYREPTNDSLRAPLGDSSVYVENVEALLGKSIDFFLTKQGREVAAHLELCWDTTDNDFATSLTVVAITLESLIRIAVKGVSIEDPGHTADDRAALLSWIAHRVGLRTQRFLERVRGFVNALDHPRPIDVLWGWHLQGLLGVTPEDIDAWEKSRHPAAHGALAGSPDRDELQQRFDRFVRVQHLMNRIVLWMIGYRGLYVDYSQPGWPEAEFPPTMGKAETKETTGAE